MRAFTLFYVIGLFSLSYGFAQSPPAAFNWRVKLHPLMLINPDKPYIQASTEFMFKEKLGFELGYGRRIADDWILSAPHTSIPRDSAEVKFKGNSFFCDVRYYVPIQRNRKNYRDYLYLSLAYRNVNDLRNHKLMYEPALDSTVEVHTREILTEYCGIQRNLTFLTFKTGVMYEFNRLGAEAFLEMGTKHKRQSLIGNELGDAGYERIWGFLEPSVDPVNRWFPHLGMGFRVIYRLF